MQFLTQRNEKNLRLRKFPFTLVGQSLRNFPFTLVGCSFWKFPFTLVNVQVAKVKEYMGTWFMTMVQCTWYMVHDNVPMYLVHGTWQCTKFPFMLVGRSLRNFLFTLVGRSLWKFPFMLVNVQVRKVEEYMGTWYMTMYQCTWYRTMYQCTRYMVHCQCPSSKSGGVYVYMKKIYTQKTFKSLHTLQFNTN